MSIEDLAFVELDLKNMLMSFGVTEEDAEKIDKMIDTTINLNLEMKEDNFDLPVHGDARER